MNNRRIALPLAGVITALLTFAAGAAAQPAPGEMRSGTTSGFGGLTTVGLFTVPGGMNFVLTDLEWVPDMNTGASPIDILRLPLALRGGMMDRCSWHAVLFRDTDGGRHSMNLPLSVHWTTGVVFSSGETVSFVIGDLNALTNWRLNWSGYVWSADLTDAGSPESGAPAFSMRATPNPTESRARIDFSLPVEGAVLVGVFDVEGRRVRALFEGTLSRGEHSLTWDGLDEEGRPAGHGIYFARLETAEACEVQKVTRVR